MNKHIQIKIHENIEEQQNVSKADLASLPIIFYSYWFGVNVKMVPTNNTDKDFVSYIYILKCATRYIFGSRKSNMACHLLNRF